MTADLTIFKKPGVVVQVIDGDPPVDQTALVASLNALVADQNGQIQTLTVERDAALALAGARQSKIDVAKAALA